MTEKWKLLARHKHLSNIVISEMINDSTEGWGRRYIATIHGFQKFRLAQGAVASGDFSFADVCKRAEEIRERIEANDETVFQGDTAIVWNEGWLPFLKAKE